MQRQRVSVYIDGFNLYHAIDQLRTPHLKWLDLQSLAGSLVREHEQLSKVHYFSALATWRLEAVARHRIYIAALRSTGVEVHLSQFKEKPGRCRRCGSTWTRHEEKETDVLIASSMLRDALNNDVERLILISADTDLRPPIRIIASERPHIEVFVATPPRRFGQCRALGPQLELSGGRLAQHLLPSSITTPSGRQINRPPSYDPPA